MSWPATHLFDLASDWLDALVTGYAVAHVDLPARRYVHVGQVAHDGEQCTVGFGRVFTGPPGGEGLLPLHRGGIVRSLELEAQVVRCVPTPTETNTNVIPPTPAALQASAETLLTDAWLLITLTADAWRSASFTSRCDHMVIVRCEPVGPQGGLGGVQVTVQASL